MSYEGSTYALESSDPEDVLRSLERHLRRCDPDVILTEYGDAVLLPMLTRLAAEHQVPLSLNRDTGERLHHIARLQLLRLWQDRPQGRCL